MLPIITPKQAIFTFIFAFLGLLLALPTQAQVVTNGSLNGGPIGNNRIPNAAGWTKCGGSPDLCNVTFPSYLTTSQVTPTNSPDGGNWLGLASINASECAQTTITGLTIGNSYTLYFCGGSFGTGSTLFNMSPVFPRVSVGATVQNYSVPMAASTWVPLQLAFTATATTMTLQCSHPVSTPANSRYASLDGFNLTTPCGGVLLPFQLLSFNAFAKEDYSVQTTWQTASEINSASFSIERSTDGILFQPIGEVIAVGNSQSTEDYDFLDNHLPITNGKKGGVFYYRLKQIDNNGSYYYSEVRAVSFPSEDLSSFNVYPNPSKDILNIDFLPAASKGQHQIKIFNVLGQVIYEKAIATQTGINHLQLDIQDYSAGSYTIELSSATITYRRKFIKN